MQLDAPRNQLDASRSKELRTHHFKIGLGDGTYDTSSKRYGESNGEAGRIDPDRLKDLKATHFTYGNDQAELKTSTQQEYGIKTAENAKLDQSHLKNLRVHHFNLGVDSTDYKTSYKSNFIKHPY